MLSLLISMSIYFLCLEGKPKCQTGGKSKRTIQGTHKTTKQVQHIYIFFNSFPENNIHYTNLNFRI